MTEMRRAIDSRYPAALLAILLVGVASCGGASRAYEEPRYVEPEREDPVELTSEQTELERALSEALARPEPDCSLACDLTTRICALSERICAIADRHAGDEELSTRCRDAGGRCDSARERASEQCACE